MDIEATLGEIVALEPTILGIQLIFHAQVGNSVRLAQHVKSRFPGCQVVVGGHVPTFSTHDLLAITNDFEFLVRGEGEGPMLDLVAALKGGGVQASQRARLVKNVAYLDGEQVVVNPQREIVSDLDCLAFPVRDSRDYAEFPHASIVATRGCYARCEFCSVPQFFMGQGPLWRLRSVENTIEEMRSLNKEFGVTHFSFLDDIFLGTDTRSKRRATDLARQIKLELPGIRFAIECRADSVEQVIFEKLKAAGLERVFLGLEAGNQADLERFNKWTSVKQNRDALALLRELGIHVAFGFINFHPDSTLDGVEENVEFLAQLHLAYPFALCTRLDAYPGTPIWERLKTEHRLIGPPLTPTYEYSDPAIERLYQIFQEFFADRRSDEALRKRAEFRQSTLPVAARPEYDTACALMSSATGDAAQSIISCVRLGNEVPEETYRTYCDRMGVVRAMLEKSAQKSQKDVPFTGAGDHL